MAKPANPNTEAQEQFVYYSAVGPSLYTTGFSES
jgi:hypothetical protein